MDIGVPRGFKDTLYGEAELRERLSYEIGSYFASKAYRLIETPLVERTIVSDCAVTGGLKAGASLTLETPFRFVDVDGELLSLRADVTLPIARTVVKRLAPEDAPYRFRYSADVFREQEALRGQPRVMSQIGIELLGVGGAEADSEVLTLALGALEVAQAGAAKLHISTVQIYSEILSCAVDALSQQTGTSNDGVSQQGAEPSQNDTSALTWAERVRNALHSGDFVEVETLVNTARLSQELKTALIEIPKMRGTAEIFVKLTDQLAPIDPTGKIRSAVEGLERTYSLLTLSAPQSSCIVDLSITRDFDYYTGLVFEAYAQDLGSSLGGGGRYDRLVEQNGKPLPAAGFALDLDQLAEQRTPCVRVDADLHIAIPKGVLYEPSLDLLEQAGFNVAPLRDPKRQLRFNVDRIDYIIAKPTDVAIYVANGAADCGIGGKDTLTEADFPLLELADLGFGPCEFAVAQPSSETISLRERAVAQGVVRVATKYPRITARYFEEQGIPAEIIKLNGNIELAPLIGISDVVVDLTATGETLRKNNLTILDTFAPSTARFVANPVSARTNERVFDLAAIFARLTKGEA